jgi:hypothetical protein
MPEEMLDLYQVLEEEFKVLHGPLPSWYAKQKETKLEEAAVENAKLKDASLKDRLKGEEETRYKTNEALVAALNACVHERPSDDQRAALCISGGGIRSATFALGIMQGLARCGLLNKFHYISTVSGGGYIGSWLTSWIHHKNDDVDAVINELKHPIPNKLKPEPPQLRHLRQYSNYLSPRSGLLSADTWTLIAIYVRNLLLNWLVLIPFLAFGLMIPRVYAAFVRAANNDDIGQYSGRMYVCLWAGLGAAAMAIFYIGYNRPSSAGAKRDYSQKAYTWLCLLPLVVSTLLLTIFWAWGVRNGALDHSLIYFAALFASVNLVGLLAWASLSRRAGSKSSADKRLRTKRTFQEAVASAVSGAAAGWLIWLVSTAGFLFEPDAKVRIATFTCFAVPILLAIFIVSAIFFGGLISFIVDDEDREWWSRSDAWVLIVILGWSAFSAIALFGPIAIGRASAYITGAGGFLAVLISVLRGWSARTQGNPSPKESLGAPAPKADWILKIALPISILVTLCFLTLGNTALLNLISGSVRFGELQKGGELIRQFSLTLIDVPDHIDGDYFDHYRMLYWSPVWLVSALALALFGAAALMAWFVDINRFSLHAMYRNRLVRAYLGASNPRRQPNKFTGFDPNDSLRMHNFWPATNPDRRNKLLHVINIALNLVHGSDLALQQRKAESFTVTALHSGSSQLGYRSSKTYGDAKGITMGTAVAISGAAASPNMGYHTSTVLSFLMTLFNARLGWWLGNPGKPGAGKLTTYNKRGPRWALRPLVAESLGFTDDANPYVYLSDGGHFENLGLYEMVRRRCRYIVVSDGGQDAKCTFEDLGGAVRKIRIDFGISIDFLDRTPIFARSDDKETNRAGKYCSVGTINYSDVDGDDVTPGVLIYLKPAFYGREGFEPRDVCQYAMSSMTFPHETTANQFFTESQFESYRALGSHVIERICGNPCTTSSLSKFEKKARTHAAASAPVPGLHTSDR